MSVLSTRRNRIRIIFLFLSLAFACLSLVITIDFLLPRKVEQSKIIKMEMDDAYHPRFSRNSTYTIQLATNEIIRTDRETFTKLHTNDKIRVERTMILKKIILMTVDVQPIKHCSVYVAPFTYFPLYPILFFLPLVFVFVKSDSVFGMIVRPLSIGIAILSLFMILL